METKNLKPITETTTFSKPIWAWCWNDKDVEATKLRIYAFIVFNGQLKAITQQEVGLGLYDNASLIEGLHDNLDYEIVSITHETTEGIETSRGVFICEVENNVFEVYTNKTKTKIYKPLSVEYRRKK